MIFTIAENWDRCWELHFKRVDIIREYPDLDPENPDTERIESPYDHHLICSLRITVDHDFPYGGISGLCPSGKILPFEEIRLGLDGVFRAWNGKYVYPFDDRLTYDASGAYLAWEGYPERRRFPDPAMPEWVRKEGRSVLCKINFNASGEREDVPLRLSPSDLIRLSFPSSGALEEVACELLMDVIRRLIISKEDYNRSAFEERDRIDFCFSRRLQDNNQENTSISELMNSNLASNNTYTFTLKLEKLSGNAMGGVEVTKKGVPRDIWDEWLELKGEGAPKRKRTRAVRPHASDRARRS